MNAREIELLHNQIQKLHDRRFNLESWKTQTILLLDGIFGENNNKSRQIQKIEYEYSSWTLRDTSGSSSMDDCKRTGQDILEIAIRELENHELPKPAARESQAGLSDIVVSALENELKGWQFKQILQIIRENTEPESKKARITEALNTYGPGITTDILATILSDPGLKF